jgi:hypothetical protein
VEHLGGLAEVPPRQVAFVRIERRVPDGLQRVDPFEIRPREIQRVLGEALGLAEPEPTERVMRGAEQPLDRGGPQRFRGLAARLVGELGRGEVVVGEQLRELGRAFPRGLFEPPRHVPVRVDALTPGE